MLFQYLLSAKFNKYKLNKSFISRLNKTLYIYTYGIDNLFNQLLSFVKNSTSQQTKDNKILDNFWNSFIKHLQGCTSFQTTFQKVQKTHLAKISELRQSISKLQQLLLNQRQSFQDQKISFQKRILALMNEQTKLTNQLRVVSSTLLLTDQAFNQQVQLRLKFQQKVNHVYTSYDQLKGKYLSMMSNLNIKSQQSIAKQNLQESLYTKIRQLQCNLQKTQSLIHQLQVKHQAMQKITQTIENLKSTKNKYQQLFKIIQTQKQSLQKQKNQIYSKYTLQKQQIIGLKMLHQNRQKYIKQIQIKHDKQKQLLKRKNTGYNQIVTKKESMILNYQKIQENKNNQLLGKSYRIENLQIEVKKQYDQIDKKNKQVEFFIKSLEEKEFQIKRLKEELKKQQEAIFLQCNQNNLTKQQLESLKKLYQLIKSQENSCIKNINTLYEQYRSLVNKKGQHIHPMLYEDLAGQFNKVKLQVIPNLQTKLQKRQKQNIELKENVQELELNLRNQAQKVEILQIQQENNQQLISTLNQNISSLNSTISTQFNQLQKKSLLYCFLKRPISIMKANMQHEVFNIWSACFKDRFDVMDYRLNISNR